MANSTAPARPRCARTARRNIRSRRGARNLQYACTLLTRDRLVHGRGLTHDESMTNELQTAPEIDFDKLSPEVRRDIRKLCTLNNYRAPLGVLFDYAVIAFSIWLCVGVSYWFYPVSLVLIGSTYRALAHLQHDSAHKILARNHTWNLLLGTVFSGYLIFHLFTPYRNSHIGGHHRFLGDAEKDPDYAFHLECGLYDHRQPTKRFLARNVLLSVLGLRAPEYVRYIVRDRLMFRSANATVSSPISMRAELAILAAQWIAVFAVCALLGQLHLLLLFWFVPMFTTAVAIGWLCELAEHFPLPESESKRILLTRNRHGWWIERFLFGRHNENLHAVHHVSAGVPYWNAKKAHAVMMRDEAYARWSGMWAGIFTRTRAERGKETLVSYATTYREWRRRGGDPARLERSFAESMTLSRSH